MGKQPRTDLALSRLCLKRTRPPFSSAQPKVSPRFSSWASVPPPLPSSPNRSSSPLLGAWTRLKTSRSDGLSGSVTCSRVAGSGANAPRGTSREPLTRRTGGRLFTVEGRKWNEYKSHLSRIRLSESREKFILELQVWFCFRDSSCRNETYKKQWREGIERSMSHTLKSICQFFLFKINQHLWKGADLPLRMFDSVSTKHDGNLRDGENNGGYETGGLTGGPCQASHSNCARQKRMFQPSGRHQACFPGCRIGFDGLWRSISASSVQTHSLRRAWAEQLRIPPNKHVLHASAVSQEPADRDTMAVKKPPLVFGVKAESWLFARSKALLLQFPVSRSDSRSHATACLHRCKARQTFLGILLWWSLGCVEGEKNNTKTFLLQLQVLVRHFRSWL